MSIHQQPLLHPLCSTLLYCPLSFLLRVCGLRPFMWAPVLYVSPPPPLLYVSHPAHLLCVLHLFPDIRPRCHGNLDRVLWKLKESSKAARWMEPCAHDTLVTDLMTLVHLIWNSSEVHFLL